MLEPVTPTAEVREELPPLSGGELVAMHNAGGFDRAIRRLLAQALPVERSRERDLFLLRAAGLVEAGHPYTVARVLLDRLQVLALYFPRVVDVSTLDGALAAALLLNGRRVPSAKTIQRALE